PGKITKAIVTKVDDEWGLTYVRFAESKGLIDVETMKWARKPDPEVDARWAPEVTKPSTVLKQGDVIYVRVVNGKFGSTRLNDKIRDLREKNKKNFTMPESLPKFDEYAEVHLEQEPKAQAALLAIDQKTDDVVSMVGGYEAVPGQLNRSIQALRQTGSSFKTIVYTAALDHGYTPSSMILDAPIVFEEEQEVEGSDNKEMITKRWKPTNHSNRFMGDILFRNALIQS